MSGSHRPSDHGGTLGHVQTAVCLEGPPQRDIRQPAIVRE